MLANKMILGIVSIVFLFIANRIHFGHNCGLRTLADYTFEALGTITGIVFCAMLAYENQTLYVIPQIAFFISVCMFVRHKTRKKFCLPFWKTARFAILALVIFGGGGYMLELMNVLITKEDVATTVVIIGGMLTTIIAMVAATNCIFNHILSRRRVSSYYY